MKDGLEVTFKAGGLSSAHERFDLCINTMRMSLDPCTWIVGRRLCTPPYMRRSCSEAGADVGVIPVSVVLLACDWSDELCGCALFSFTVRESTTNAQGCRCHICVSVLEAACVRQF